MIYFKLLGFAGPTRLLLEIVLVPVSAVLFEFLFLSKTPELIPFVGLALMDAGVSAVAKGF